MREFIKKPVYNTQYSSDPLKPGECRGRVYTDDNGNSLAPGFDSIPKPTRSVWNLIGQVGADLLIGYYLRKLFIAVALFIVVMFLMAKMFM